MAHMMKIKAGGVAPLVAHYERRPEIERGYERENIDPTRTSQNYNLRPSDVVEDVKLAMAQHEQTSQRAVRSDANVLFDWVVTKPKDCPPESARAFFEAVVEFIEGRYGKGNVLGAYVHMDETTPHMHVPVLPMIDGKLQASKMVNRKDLQGFHGDLGKHVDDALGFHVSIELDEEKHIEKAMSSLDQDEMALASERLERLRQRTDELESVVAEVRRFEGASGKEKGAALGRIAQRCDEVRGAIERRIDGLVERIAEVKARIRLQARNIETAGKKIGIGMEGRDLATIRSPEIIRPVHRMKERGGYSR